jgi:hypothetical protein
MSLPWRVVLEGQVQTRHPIHRLEERHRPEPRPRRFGNDIIDPFYHGGIINNRQVQQAPVAMVPPLRYHHKL